MDILIHYFGATTFGTIGAIILWFGCWLWLKQIVLATTKFAGVLIGAGDKLGKFIDPTPKYRANKAKGNLSGALEGTRFHGTNRATAFANKALQNVGTVAKTDRKTDLFTKEGWDAAVTKQQSEEAIEHAGTKEAKAAQYNDAMHRALTFGSEVEARANYKRRFAYTNDKGKIVEPDDDEVEKGIRAARQAGGWSRGRQLYSTKQLVATGTGFNDINQAYHTIAEVAGDNEGLQNDMAGGLKANQARPDFHAGFGTHTSNVKLARAGQLTHAHSDAAMVEALESVGAMDALRSKPTAVKNIAGATRRVLLSESQIAEDQSAPIEVREAAQKHVGQLIGINEQLEQVAAYAPPVNVQHAEEQLTKHAAVGEIRKQVIAQVPEHVQRQVQVVNPDGTTSTEVRIEPNQQYNPNVAGGYNQQSPSARMRPWQPPQPGDPHFPGGN